MHSRTLKRKAAEEIELSKFIAEWTDPYPIPDFTLWRPTKIRRSNRAIGLFYVPATPPNTPTTTICLSTAKGAAQDPLDGDNFHPSPIQKSWIKKKPFLAAKYRRNYKLKTDFADTTGPLVVALGELAERTLKKLNEEEHWHEEGENRLGHDLLLQVLEKKRKAKIECMDTRRKFQMTMSESWYEYDKAVIEGEFKV